MRLAAAISSIPTSRALISRFSSDCTRCHNPRQSIPRLQPKSSPELIMGTNSRSARSGQKSGIGKRPARSSNIGSDPQVPHSSPVLLSPASTSSPRATSAPKRKSLTSGSSSCRSSTNSRVSRKPARPSAPRPEPAEEIDEFIADIIVVNTDSPDHLDDMGDEVSESLKTENNFMYVAQPSLPSRDSALCTIDAVYRHVYSLLYLTTVPPGRILTTLILISSLRLTLMSLLRRPRSRLRRGRDWPTQGFQPRMHQSQQRLRELRRNAYLQMKALNTLQPHI